MEIPSFYIPVDRRLAIIRGESLPEFTLGTALFADISGFTPLTEYLANNLGARRGAEELSVYLNRVYDALIVELHRYGGSVIGFAGDAITCWLDQDDGCRAVTSALAMHRAMQQFSRVEISTGETISLDIKVAVVNGPVRRFIVGDPDYLILDVMAGNTLVRLADAEHQAERGEVILDEATAISLQECINIIEWRQDESTGNRYALVSDVLVDVPESPWPNVALEALKQDQVRPWILPRICERMEKGRGEFIAELRPAVSLFFRFRGLDYDLDDQAAVKLDAYVRQVEQVFKQYDGSITHLTIGDKGSYVCSVFGAPISHEDNAVRAVSTAMALQDISSRFDFIDDIQVGITQGRMWIGSYGSSDRRTYDLLGDVVNLAARLMSAAAAGQVLANESIRAATQDQFSWELLTGIRVKGKADDVAVASLRGFKRQKATCLRVPSYTLPMVGRELEIQQIRAKLELALSGSGQILGITGEAGMGKSRLAAEVIRMADELGFTGYGGECQSYGTGTSYLPWQNVWRCFFGLDSAMPLAAQIEVLEQEVGRLNPSLLPRVPLLGVVLNIPVPDNDLTSSLSAKLRKSSLEGMLVECLKARSMTKPLLLVLEDCHWLDTLSQDLIEVLGRSLVNVPVIMLLVYRPLELQQPNKLRVVQMPHFTEVKLSEFTSQEADQLIQLKLTQFFGDDLSVSPALIERITIQASGNPFYIEELLNYLQDLGIDPSDDKAISALDLPDSIHSLILTRMDQLTDRQKIAIKVASVIGRLFVAAMLWGIYPKLGDTQKVFRDLNDLTKFELIILDTPEPELAYLFKHIFTQQVAYESLPHSTRALLHSEIGRYIEQEFSDSLDQQVYILAHHYEHSENIAKKREYLLKAGEAAQRDYANLAAIDYFNKVLPLLPADHQVEVKLKLGKVQELIGDFEQAGDTYEQALSQAEQLGDLDGQAWSETAIAEFYRKQGRFEEASKRLLHAKDLFEKQDDLAGVGQALRFMGSIADQTGDFEKARELMRASLTILQQLGDQKQSAYLLGNLGIVARRQGNLGQARSLYEESLVLRREVGDRWGIANVLNNLGNVLVDLGDLSSARSSLEEAVGIHTEIGDRWAIGNALNNLGNVLRTQGDYAAAKQRYHQSLAIYRDLGDKWALAYLFEDIAWLAALQGYGYRASLLVAAGAVLREQIKAPLTPTESSKLEAAIVPAIEGLSETEQDQAIAQGRGMALEQVIVYAFEE